MELIEQFKEYLLSQKNKPSKATVKNYKADVLKFIAWFEGEFNKEFIPLAITRHSIELYKEFQTKRTDGYRLSSRSIERHLSSLRKFFAYLLKKKIITSDPMHELASKASSVIAADIWHIKEFRDYLYTHDASYHTIKNYIVDIQNFLGWAEKVLQVDNRWKVEEKNVLDLLNAKMLGEYKQRLFYDLGLSPRSINRKLSALRKYLRWTFANGLVKTNFFEEQNSNDLSNALAFPTSQTKDHVTETENENTSEDIKENISITGEASPSSKYADFAPIRFLQKTSTGIAFVFDHVFLTPLAQIVIKGKYLVLNQGKQPLIWDKKSTLINTFPYAKTNHLDFKVSNFTKAFYAPLTVSTQYYPLHAKAIHTILHKRPKWYKEYHSFSVVHYFHFAILLIFTSTIGFGLYDSFIQKPRQQKPVEAASLIPEKTFYFTGRLTDINSNPITDAKRVIFSLYHAQIADGSLPIWQEIDTIAPNTDGNFSLLLGKSNALSQSILTDGSSLYLGIAVGSDAELIPRQQLATVSYAGNAQFLQGLSPITSENAGTSNVVLALDSGGNLIIGDKASPTFQATGGQFTLSGSQVLVTTNVGTNTDVQIAPDGTGKIDLQKPVFNSSNNNNIAAAAGSVEIDDMLSILATSSSQSAFLINQNSMGPLISASTSGVAKFTVNSDGSSYFAGNLGIGTTNPLAKLHIEAGIIGKALAIFNETGNQNIFTASASGITKFSVDRNGNILSAKGAQWKPIADDPSALTIANAVGTSFVNFDTTNSRVGIGLTTPLFKLDLTDNQSATASAMITNSNTGSDADVLALKVGNTTPSATNYFTAYLNGNGAIVGKVAGNGSGGVSFATSGSDFAEYYRKEDQNELFDTGDIVCLGKTGGATKCTNASYSLLGVVSKNPGFIGGVNKENDPNYILIGLTGQVPVKTSDENGHILAADPLEIGNTPGVGVKATQKGYIIGKALETNTSSSLNTIMISLGVSWYDPSVLLTTTGDLNIIKNTQQQNPTNQYSLLNTTTNNIITAIGAFSDASIANLTAGVIAAKDITTNSLAVATDNMTISGKNIKDYILDTIGSQTLVAPIASIQEVQTNIISPIDKSSPIAVTLNNGTFSIRNGHSVSDTAVASIDTSGNASFSGQLRAKEITTDVSHSTELTTNDASVSGTLRADTIIANNIEGLDAKISTLAASLRTADTSTQALNAGNLSSETPLLLEPVSLASFSAQLANVDTLTAAFGTFTQGLMAFGPTSVADLSVAGQFSVGGQLIITNTAINTLGSTLEIQPLRQGNLSFMGGLVTVDTQGNLDVSGDATFAKNLYVLQTLSTHFLSPIPNSDLIVKLGTNQQSVSASATTSSVTNHTPNFVIQNASGSAVLTVNQQGDILASGSATVGDILTKNLGIVRNAQADTSFTETIASSSAGTATIITGETQRTIITPYVKDNSLVYLSPTSDTDGITPYVSRQTSENTQQDTKGSFTIEIVQRLTHDISLNWWIVN